jgi:hypothetical protein
MTKPRKDTVIAGVSRCLYAAKLEGMTNPTPGHPERSEAESKDPAALPTGIATGFLDFARNDRPVLSSFGLRAFFVIRHSCFVISAS